MPIERIMYFERGGARLKEVSIYHPETDNVSTATEYSVGDAEWDGVHPKAVQLVELSEAEIASTKMDFDVEDFDGGI